MSEIQDMTTVIELGSKGTYYLIKGSIKAGLALLQLMQKLIRAGEFQVGELESINKLLKASNGQVQILNIPTEESTLLERMRLDLNQLQLPYIVMPDMNVGDGQTQIAFAKKDEQLIGQWFQTFCTDQLLQGGRRAYDELLNLTGGQVDIVSIPLDEEDEQMKEKMLEDFHNLRMNYCLLPDLNVGDRRIQMVYAQADAPKLREWFSQYQQDYFKRTGTLLPELQQISMDGYAKTAYQSTADYWGTASDLKQQQINARAQAQAGGNLTPTSAEDKKKFMTQIEYQQALSEPGALEITINEKLIIDKNDEGVMTKIPYQNQFVIIPAEQVYRNIDKGKTYAAILNRSQSYRILDRSGRMMGEKTGAELYKSYDLVERDIARQNLDRVKQVGNTIDVPQIGKRL